MHTNKNRFSLPKDLIYTVSQLPKDKAGELFMYILAFVNNHEPTSDDIVIKLAFEPIKQYLLRDCNIRKNRAIARRILKPITKDNKSEQSGTKVNKVEQNVSKDNKSEQSVTNSKTSGIVTPPKPPKPVINYQEIIDAFNKICHELPKASVTEERKRKINTLLKKYTPGQLANVIIKTSQSDYLTGKKVDWKADLDWILKPANFVRILEGVFDNNNSSKNSFPTPEEQWEEASDAVNKFYDPE